MARSCKTYRIAIHGTNVSAWTRILRAGCAALQSRAMLRFVHSCSQATARVFILKVAATASTLIVETK
jgi:hypothetical protein